MRKLILLLLVIFPFYLFGQTYYPGHRIYDGKQEILPGNDFVAPSVSLDSFLVIKNDTVYYFTSDTTNATLQGKYHLPTVQFLKDYVSVYGGGTGDVEEAPIDGRLFGRKDGAWTEVVGGSNVFSTLEVLDSFRISEVWIRGVQDTNLLAVDNLKTKNLIVGNDTVDNLCFTKTRILSVGSSNCDFSLIQDAFDSINAAGSSPVSIWVVELTPEVHIVNNSAGIVKFPEYTSLISKGGISTAVIFPTSPGNLFEMSNITRIEGVNIVGVSNGSALLIEDPGNMQISDMFFQNSDTALTVNCIDCIIDFKESYFFADEVIYKGLNMQSGIILVNEVGLLGQDTVKVPFWIEGSNSIATINNASSFSANVDTFLYATNGAKCVTNNNNILAAKNGLMSFNGSDVRFNGNSHFKISGKYTDNDETSILGGYANNDDNDEAIIFEGQEVHVGDASKGFEMCIGGGDSYSDDISVWTFDGASTWANYSDSVRYIDGSGVQFPNNNTGTCIYIASTVNDTFIHHGLKVDIIESMDAGTGEVVMEYWDGAAWVEENAMVSKSSSAYYPYAKQYFEQDFSTHLRYNIVMTNDNWALTDDMSAGTLRKYIRFRIKTPITSSFNIDQIKLHPERWEANSDGFTELFGNARHTEILNLNIGGGNATKGNLGNQTVWADADIGVGYTENNFNANGDMLGYPINFADNTDTGCPVNLVISGRSAAAQIMTFTVRWKIVKPSDPLYTAEPTASGESGSFIVDAIFSSGLNELEAIPIDISNAIPSRENGFGDQLWLTIERTSGTANFALTNIGAEYWTWAEGGAY